MSLLKEPLVVKGGYVFDKHIFFIAGVVINLFLIGFIFDMRTHPFYYECKMENLHPCMNPFYYKELFQREFCTLPAKLSQYCEPMTLLPGESLGPPPTWLMRHEELVLYLAVLPFLLNHLVHNRRFNPWKKSPSQL